MRKLIISMNLSLDGLTSGSEGELDWHVDSWDEGMSEKLLGQLDNADTLLLGRITYNAIAAYWSAKSMGQDTPRQDLAIADKMNHHIKIVFSKTNPIFRWNNTKFVHADFEREIFRLKKGKGKDILVFGSCTLASSIIQSNLVDEYHLWVHPVILGKGNQLFKNLKTNLHLILSGSVIFESGVVLLNYRSVPE